VGCQPRSRDRRFGPARRGGGAAAGRVTFVFPGATRQAKGRTSQGWGRGLGLGFKCTCVGDRVLLRLSSGGNYKAPIHREGKNA
jgi:hypothetical protein